MNQWQQLLIVICGLALLKPTILVKFCHCFHIGFILLTLKYLFDTHFKLICQRLYFLGCVSAPAAHGVHFH